MRGRRIPGAAAALAFAALQGCVTATPMQPLVRLDDRSCTPRPVLDGPAVVGLPFDKAVTVEVSGQSACLEGREGMRSSYVVLMLPEVSEPYVVTVASVPRGDALMSPRLLVLDAGGATLRERQRDAFMFHGTTLQAGMRAYPGDRYLVVASDPPTVGKKVSKLIGSTQSTMVPMGTGMFVMYSGSERAHGATFAHNGEITVRAQPVPRVN